MLDFENSAFDEIGEIYGGFPLRENFMEIGNAALKEFGVEAEYEDGQVQRSLRSTHHEILEVSGADALKLCPSGQDKD